MSTLSELDESVEKATKELQQIAARLQAVDTAEVSFSDALKRLNEVTSTLQEALAGQVNIAQSLTKFANEAKEAVERIKQLDPDALRRELKGIQGAVADVVGRQDESEKWQKQQANEHVAQIDNWHSETKNTFSKSVGQLTEAVGTSVAEVKAETKEIGGAAELMRKKLGRVSILTTLNFIGWVVLVTVVFRKWPDLLRGLW